MVQRTSPPTLFCLASTSVMMPFDVEITAVADLFGGGSAQRKLHRSSEKPLLGKIDFTGERVTRGKFKGDKRWWASLQRAGNEAIRLLPFAGVPTVPYYYIRSGFRAAQEQQKPKAKAKKPRKERETKL